MEKRNTLIIVGLVCLVISLVLVGRYAGNNQTNSVIKAKVAPIGTRIRTSGCQANGALPDKDCTPGAILNSTKSEICTPGYSTKVRNVTVSTKNQVYAEYGIVSHTTGEYEVDHLISLELGGSNDIANLWPEAAKPTPGFHEKDKVENYLHDQVCNGSLDLKDAQEIIANDWLTIYKQMGN